jgi:dTDP-4-dehydrorhamnose reductase
MSDKIIVTGSRGQLGSELGDLVTHYPQYDFVFYSREEFPINDPVIARQVMEEHRPAWFINSAAYTAVDKAESETDLANEINGTAVGMLALLCKEFGTKFIHVSTDYVFNGNQESPLKESDKVDPINAYGASKLLGEDLAIQNNPGVLIIRTAWVYSSYGKNFVKTMLRLMKEKESINVVGDQYGAPTYAADLAEAIMQIIDSGKWIPGIYNFSNEGRISWYDFAKEIREISKLNCTVNPIKTEQYPTPAKRPAYSVLDKSKIIATYSISLKDWKESLRICMKKLQAV